MNQVDKFLSLKCSADVLEAVQPLKNASKEISESMILIEAVRSYVLGNQNVTLVDLCAGNALTSVIAAHLLPVERVIAIDIRPNKRNGYANVKRFEYLEANIFVEDLWYKIAELDPVVVVASHACKNLASHIANQTRAFDLHLAMLTCCQNYGSMNAYFRDLGNIIGKYAAWTAFVAHQAEGRFKLVKECLSPANGLVTRRL